MTDTFIIVTDTGFHTDSWQGLPVLTSDKIAQADWDKLSADSVLQLENNVPYVDILPVLSRIDRISILFPDSADGRGYSLARNLRLNGFNGRLRAQGQIIADQYRHARQSGFDEVAISPEWAERIPQAHWQEQATRIHTSYQQQIYAS